MILAAASKPGVPFAFIEGCLTVIAVAIAFALPRLGAAWFLWLERSFLRLARRRGMAVTVVGATAFLLRLALLPLSPIPQPFTPDDFSFLLAGDIFASAR